MKVDFKKTLDSYRARSGQFRLLEVPELQYLMIDGHGDPNAGGEYAEAIATIYPLAYTLKFTSKNDLNRDYVVPPLEALWWADDMTAFTSARDKSAWDWTAMLLTPEWITTEMFEAAVEKVATKPDVPMLGAVRLEPLQEGTCVQTLHLGPYDDEAETLAMLHSEFMPANGLQFAGRHHEIYLSDPRRTAPEKLRTILRQPVKQLEQ